MDYKTLTDEQKDALLENTLAQIEQEHYSTVLALTRAEVSGNEVQAKIFEKSLADLEAQHEALYD